MKKQYNRPYCTLTLDGFDENSEIVAENQDNINSSESLISIITSAECYFAASNQRLQGGRAFLENLASAVSNYVQELLSGLSHPQDNQKDYPKIQIAPTDATGRHHLIFQPDPNLEQSEQKIALKTVELFDLVEVIDQFYTDRSTLPDVSLKLETVGRGSRQAEEPLAQRAIPVVAGTVSLALAAGIFFMLPVPKTFQPKPNSVSPTETLPNLPETSPVKPNN